jgi:hypothetical protein
VANQVIGYQIILNGMQCFFNGEFCNIGKNILSQISCFFLFQKNSPQFATIAYTT